MRRFSIRTLMALVLVSAFGLAALRNANELWATVSAAAAARAAAVAVSVVVVAGVSTACSAPAATCL